LEAKNSRSVSKTTARVAPGPGRRCAAEERRHLRLSVNFSIVLTIGHEAGSKNSPLADHTGFGTFTRITGIPNYESQTQLIKRLLKLPSQILILGIRLYQVCLSPLLGQNCRFTPSCSNYCIESLRKYGAIKGSAKGVWRILRCNPFNRGGYDPP
jgi:putative membrane protein insertion efficiency factor